MLETSPASLLIAWRGWYYDLLHLGPQLLLRSSPRIWLSIKQETAPAPSDILSPISIPNSTFSVLVICCTSCLSILNYSCTVPPVYRFKCGLPKLQVFLQRTLIDTEGLRIHVPFFLCCTKIDVAFSVA